MSTNSLIEFKGGIAGSSGYGGVGWEYYDKKRHPTCAAFSLASERLISRHLSPRSIKNGEKLCDVGAGRSVVASLLGSSLSRVDTLYLIDESREMLSWSDSFSSKKISRKIARSSTIDNLGIEFDIIVAALGDPYNDAEFWMAASNALRSRGVCLFTTPSFEWANEYRNEADSELSNSALFDMSDGSRHYVPSLIWPVSEQCSMFREAGLEIVDIDCCELKDLPLRPPKLCMLDASTPVVTLYRVQHA